MASHQFTEQEHNLDAFYAWFSSDGLTIHQPQGPAFKSVAHSSPGVTNFHPVGCSNDWGLGRKDESEHVWHVDLIEDYRLTSVFELSGSKFED